MRFRSSPSTDMWHCDRRASSAKPTGKNSYNQVVQSHDEHVTQSVMFEMIGQNVSTAASCTQFDLQIQFNSILSNCEHYGLDLYLDPLNVRVSTFPPFTSYVEKKAF